MKFVRSTQLKECPACTAPTATEPGFQKVARIDLPISVCAICDDLLIVPNQGNEDNFAMMVEIARAVVARGR